ncbi:MAG TPA: peptide ABC transporter substrate-binding protein [Candidatus Limnocylindrales bacterium]
MNRVDRFVIGSLVVLFALIASLVALPSALPGDTPLASSGPAASDAPLAESRPYREGTIGHATSVSPLTAHSQADRDLVALVFSGLVRNGPDGTIVPDLARQWTVDSTGAVWTFELRSDARWQDGEPVTAEDVAFTIRTLQDPSYTGPAAGSWQDVTVRTEGALTVVFTLSTPLGGFLQAATQPIVPAHILAGVPVDRLADDPFGRQPIGSGPFALVSLTNASAELRPAASLLGAEAPVPTSSPARPDSLTTPGPTLRTSGPVPYLAGIEFRFFDDPDALLAAYRRGDLDAASGLPAAMVGELASTAGSRILRYPGSTLTAVLVNLRAGQDAFATPAIRTALLEAINRPALIDSVFAMAASAASSLIPSSSILFDPSAAGTVAYDPSAAQKALKAAGWTKVANAWRRPKFKKPFTFDLLSPAQASNPAAWAAAEAVARDWKSIGLKVTHVALPPPAFVTERLAKGTFTVAVADVTVGLDPDLYPLLASSQTLSGGSNVIGLQDPALDKLLVAARKPGTTATRAAAYSALQKQLDKGRYVLPLAFADESVVVRDTVSGPVPRQVADPSDRFWDVLRWRLAANR